jgi:hypothetical protein
MQTEAVKASKASKYTAGVPVVLIGWKWNCRSGAPLWKRRKTWGNSDFGNDKIGHL